MIDVLFSYLFNFSKIKTAVKIKMTKFFLLFGKNLPVEFVNMFHATDKNLEHVQIKSETTSTKLATHRCREGNLQI